MNQIGGILIVYSLLVFTSTAQVLKPNFYEKICPDVEKIVKNAVVDKAKRQPQTVPATLRLFVHDCFVQGCDASIMILSTGSNTAEKDHQENLSLAKEGFDVINEAKAAVDAVPMCRQKVSCADILTMATRDVISMAGGPSYTVELGRRDGLSSTAASVNGQLPKPNQNLDQLTAVFAAKGLSQFDMIALSGAHTLGSSHCDQFANRIYNFSKETPVDPSLNQTYATELQQKCPRNATSPLVALDPTTPTAFDNVYYKNLQEGRGLFTSDQVLYTDQRSKQLVVLWAEDKDDFNDAFVTAMKKLGRVGVKTGGEGNIRKECSSFN